MFFRRAPSQPLAGLKRPSHPGRCPLCREVEADLELLSCPECRSTAHNVCLTELGTPVCPTLGCGYQYPLEGKLRESPRHWALRRRSRLRECRRGLREAMFATWRQQSMAFLMPFFGFSLLAYVCSLGQWISLRPLDAALLVGFLAACTVRVYMALLKQREREAEDVKQRIQRRHVRWLAALEQTSNIELGETSPPGLASQLTTSAPTPTSIEGEPLRSSAWYPHSPPSDWGQLPPISGALA